MDEYISASEAARRFGFTRSYASKLSKLAHKQGKKFPIKKGGIWIAPLNEWNKIFNDPDLIKRKSRKVVYKDVVELDEKILLTASEAAKKVGISPSWAMELARRSVKKGYNYPKKSGHVWLAPFSEWEYIFSNKNLKSWSVKKKNKNST